MIKLVCIKVLSNAAVESMIQKLFVDCGHDEQQPLFCATGCPRIGTVGGLALFMAGGLAILHEQL